MYIARSVCSGRVQEYGMAMSAVPMPNLTGAARDLYVKAYGQKRYDEFTEKTSSTVHGAIPPHTLPDPIPPFVHRPRHDAESIFWTMFAALLRAQPDSGIRESWASPIVAKTWKKLHDHEIPENPNIDCDDREGILLMARWLLENHFHPEMREVAHLLHDICVQVRPEYEFWNPRPPEEHLHEALQRLILQYLVDHRDKDIRLDPANPRPTQPPPPPEKNKTESTQSGSRQTFSRGSASLKAGEPTVVDPKRKSGSQGGRDSKRLKGLSGASVAIDEVDEPESEED